MANQNNNSTNKSDSLYENPNQNPKANKNCKYCLGTGIQSGLNLMPVEVVNYPCDCMKGVGVGKLIDAE